MTTISQSEKICIRNFSFKDLLDKIFEETKHYKLLVLQFNDSKQIPGLAATLYEIDTAIFSFTQINEFIYSYHPSIEYSPLAIESININDKVYEDIKFNIIEYLAIDYIGLLNYYDYLIIKSCSRQLIKDLMQEKVNKDVNKISNKSEYYCYLLSNSMLISYRDNENIESLYPNNLFLRISPTNRENININGQRINDHNINDMTSLINNYIPDINQHIKLYYNHIISWIDSI
jgi:hypothetical protein